MKSCKGIHRIVCKAVSCPQKIPNMTYENCLHCDQAIMEILDLQDKVIDQIILGGQPPERPKKKRKTK